jgi:hypothetical protein
MGRLGVRLEGYKKGHAKGKAFGSIFYYINHYYLRTSKSDADNGNDGNKRAIPRIYRQNSKL